MNQVHSGDSQMLLLAVHSGKLRCAETLAAVQVHSGPEVGAGRFTFSGGEPAFVHVQNTPEITAGDTWVVSAT